MLAARGAVERDVEGRWVARDDAAAELAGQLARSGHRRSMTARVARQPRTRRDTLALLALLGREIPARVVVEALAADEIKVLADLDALSRGEEVNRIGDGFFVAFRESAAAVACSIAIQRRLARHRLEHGSSPEVRIGLHLADATRKEGDFQGKGVHVAARIGALADGGEILASQPTVAHVDGLTLSEARSVVLSGLSKPIDIFAISWR